MTLASDHCECGRRKARTAESCEACAWLDGARVPLARVIHVLRMADGWISLAAVVAQSGMKRRNANQALRKLIDADRVVRFQAGPKDPAFFALRGSKGIEMPKQQTEFEETKAPTVEAVEEAAATYVCKRDARQQLTKEEKSAKGHLLQMLDDHSSELESDGDGNVVYSYYDGEREMEVRRTTSVDVTVRVKKSKDDDNVIDLAEMHEDAESAIG